LSFSSVGRQPAKDGTKALVEKTRDCIKRMVGQPAERLIAKLGPIIRGWANYHRHICAARTFRVVDRIVYQQLRKWARRTHPKKGPGWVKRKYFRLAGPGVFAVKVLRRGESRVLALPRIAKTIIERHIKVRGEANPYDPTYTEYFEKRRCFAWRVLPRGRTGQTSALRV
jgi:RNA-directed DNA polymerase